MTDQQRESTRIGVKTEVSIGVQITTATPETVRHLAENTGEQRSVRVEVESASDVAGAVENRGALLQADRGIFFATRRGGRLHVNKACRHIRGRDVCQLEVEMRAVETSLLCRTCAS